ncbi:phosphotransferase [Mucilaginibacter sp. BJC16-A38]|uniref:phosphotransferase enzyme family protein n=1 Tax=Mucilaginibacter phenanthrenivorans TaxID=1234842 RepID=UPI0021583C0F|nr:phosphotransferase [Mucilaginibacter phenanthrenivorans]MCR8556688.1 phosphotransferase [Mucilaginibacter phenanthrenivorans]
MQIFPTRYSTLSSDALNDFISERYGLRDTSCRLLIRNVSDTYIVENQTDKYIFKIYRDAHRKLDEIEGEAELLTILNDKGASVSYPIKDLSGAIIQSFNAAEGTRYGMLFTYAKGRVVNVMNEEQLTTLGREMATVHNITSSIQLNHKRIEFHIDTTIIQPLETVKPAFVELEEEYADLIAVSKTVIAKLNEFDFTNFSYGYCHYDFLPKNFHFDEDNKLTFFDFDFAGKGYLANDITSLYIHYFMEVFMNRQTREQADTAFATFVESYRKVRPLHGDELKAIPYLGFGFWVFYLGFQYDNFEDWSNIFFGPKFLKDRVMLIKKWMAYFED